MSQPSKRTERQNFIQELLLQKPLSRQELFSLLDESEYKASIPTYDRDIRDLNLQLGKDQKYIPSELLSRREDEIYLSQFIWKNKDEISFKSPSDKLYNMIIRVPVGKENFITDLLTSIFLEIDREMLGAIPGRGFVIVLSRTKRNLENIYTYLKTSKQTENFTRPLHKTEI